MDDMETHKTVSSINPSPFFSTLFNHTPSHSPSSSLHCRNVVQLWNRLRDGTFSSKKRDHLSFMLAHQRHNMLNFITFSQGIGIEWKRKKTLLMYVFIMLDDFLCKTNQLLNFWFHKWFTHLFTTTLGPIWVESMLCLFSIFQRILIFRSFQDYILLIHFEL